ncbi:hypothetical protein GQ55_6G186900 [Panicum hallii var. hallii]|uniref:Uncharacterized protein n=1 Tax=Panicum hallii var. hallii TaxID=1504633 RepID=A0A2T7D799_9POAL|nr:hypothetical protein GQ55_6G186900 [Panicum hallii var. hallii]
MALLHFASLVLFPWSPESRKAEAGEIGEGGDATGPGTQGRRSESTGARGRQDARRCPVPRCISFVSCMLVLPCVVMLMLVPAKAS